MKKLMIAMGAAALCGAVFADVTSANVVGYTSAETNAPSYSFGAPFVSIANNSGWQLKQLMPEGTSGGYDTIQFLSSANASVELQATYYSVEEVGEEWAGWCNADDEDEMLDDLTITPGTALLANIGDHDTKWTFSGAVITPGNDNKVTIDVSGQGSPFIANPIPRTITLGEIIPTGVRGGYDTIQFLDPSNASVYLQATYYSVEEVGEEWAGWCNADNEDEMLTDMPIAAGEAFLGNIDIGEAPAVKFIFPAAIEK